MRRRKKSKNEKSKKKLKKSNKKKSKKLKKSKKKLKKKSKKLKLKKKLKKKSKKKRNSKNKKLKSKKTLKKSKEVIKEIEVEEEVKEEEEQKRRLLTRPKPGCIPHCRYPSGAYTCDCSIRLREVSAVRYICLRERGGTALRTINTLTRRCVGERRGRGQKREGRAGVFVLERDAPIRYWDRISVPIQEILLDRVSAP
ncbi:hypothetical protein WMY93_014084 [Mugilogobius chulae]|uniref:Uncharacterized protein n=1 Tax=Mugilogobius chulae TaxID=88201 RepID=A0AAW0P046_9GOBI